MADGAPVGTIAEVVDDDCKGEFVWTIPSFSFKDDHDFLGPDVTLLGAVYTPHCFAFGDGVPDDDHVTIYVQTEEWHRHCKWTLAIVDRHGAVLHSCSGQDNPDSSITVDSRFFVSRDKVLKWCEDDNDTLRLKITLYPPYSDPVDLAQDFSKLFASGELGSYFFLRSLLNSCVNS